MSDIVEYLRNRVMVLESKDDQIVRSEGDALCLDAADEIERLRSELRFARAAAEGAGSLLLSTQSDCVKAMAEVQRLREALQEIVDLFGAVDPFSADHARAALEGKP